MPMTRQEMLEALGTTPDRFQSLAYGLTTDQLACRPKEGEWSIAEILNHLLVGERDVIRPRLQRMLLAAAPRFPSSATSRTGFAAEPTPGDFRADLAAFRHVRNQTVALLRRLGERDWQRIGTTPTRGTLTIEEYVRYLANHDREHLEQLQTIRSVVAH
jgi:uncharacterized damage-inducible protein DinB